MNRPTHTMTGIHSKAGLMLCAGARALIVVGSFVPAGHWDDDDVGSIVDHALRSLNTKNTVLLGALLTQCL